jgi:predicted flap endonuclease-1-like 5' DNA nuclease
VAYAAAIEESTPEAIPSAIFAIVEQTSRQSACADAARIDHCCPEARPLAVTVVPVSTDLESDDKKYIEAPRGRKDELMFISGGEGGGSGVVHERRDDV